MSATDEDAALRAIGSLDPLKPDQINAQAKIKEMLSSEDPFLDIHALFACYDTLYFRSLLLPRVEVSWSARLTLCAGICELVRNPADGNRFTRIRLKLSEPLLKYRPRSDVVNTLLHEAIHAYFFITTAWRHSRGDDGSGHGAGFLLLADAINNHGAYEVTVFHTFHDEVDSYRTHVWYCDGPCRDRAPFFGFVKRSMNRPPGKGDSWWQKHIHECGGTFTKIAEPDVTKAQLEKMSGLKRAGMQKHKIDGWITGGRRTGREQGGSEVGSVEALNREQKRVPIASNDPADPKQVQATVSCPICQGTVRAEDINDHIDRRHV